MSDDVQNPTLLDRIYEHVLAHMERTGEDTTLGAVAEALATTPADIMREIDDRPRRTWLAYLPRADKPRASWPVFIEGE